jgi:hypothetical protein
MTTSANVIEYDIYDKDGKSVGYHRQNVMCMRCNDGLEKFTPASDFEIESYGYDEEEDLWQGDRQNLEVWLSKNKPEITFKVFSIDDKVRVKRKGTGTVLEVHKGKWEHFYTVELDTKEILNEVKQGQVLKYEI